MQKLQFSLQVSSMEEDNHLDVTSDGTVDISGKPAPRKTSGTLKSCIFILCTFPNLVVAPSSLFLLNSPCILTARFALFLDSVNQGLVCVSIYGIAVNLAVYLTTVLHEGDSSAANNVSNWQGALYFCSFIGGFVGDAYLGRYRTAFSFQLIAIVGASLVALSATLPSLRPPSCQSGSSTCESATQLQIGLFYGSLYIIALGNGGYQPNILAFGADQFDEEHPTEKLQKVEYFNWFYASLTVGTLLATTILTYIENQGRWALGFWISVGMGALAFCSFVAPTTRYRFHTVEGNPLSRIAQVFVAAVRKRNVKVPSDSERLYEECSTESPTRGRRTIPHTKNFRCLDKAATVTEVDKWSSSQSVRNSWRLCTVTQVEEVKWLCRMAPIWACTILYTTAYTQVYSLFVIQGTAMDTKVGGLDVPPASMYAVDCVSVIVWILVYNYAVVPIARRWTGHVGGLTGLQRIGVGMPIMALAMVEAGLVERARRHLSTSGGTAKLSLLWQLPQYITTGLSETFTYIGMMQFFYEEAPYEMRSMGEALPQASVAIGNYVSSLLITIVNKVTRSPGWISETTDLNAGHLDHFFFLLAVISVLNFGLFLFSTTMYKYIYSQDLPNPTSNVPNLSLPLIEEQPSCH